MSLVLTRSESADVATRGRRDAETQGRGDAGTRTDVDLLILPSPRPIVPASLSSSIPASPPPNVPASASSRIRASSRTHRGFTLIEVLATLMMMAIAMPAIMHGVSLALRAADASRRRSEASILASSKLNELIWTGQWQSQTSGDFGTDWPDYTWTAQAADWQPTSSNGSNVVPTLQQTMSELDVTVKWGPLDGQQYTLSTLVYPNNPSSSMAIQNANKSP